MDAKQFIAEFGHIANAPSGVQKLREMILELAITGRLLESLEFPEKSIDFLSEIREFREKLVSSGEIKRSKPMPEIDESELPFSLPKTWSFERLGNVCEIVRGITFPASKKEKIKTIENVPCLRTANIQKKLEWGNLIYVSPSFVKRKDQWVRKGDVLISMANSYELVGKVSLVRDLMHESTFGGFIAAVRPHLLYPDFLFLLLRSPYFQNRVRSTASQTTNIANISLAGMRPIPTPIPPKEEQFRIVSKVDELMALCDQLEKQQEQKRQLQNQLRQAALQAVATATSPFELKQHWQRLQENFESLFSNPDDVDDFSAHVKELAVHGFITPSRKTNPDIEQIKTRRTELQDAYIAQKLMRKQKAISMASNSVDYPDNWDVVAFDDIAIVIGGVTKGRKLQGKEVINCPYLAVANVQRGYFKLENLKVIDIAVDELEKYLVKEGDLLITEGGDWDKVGRTAVWTENIENCLHQNHVFKARVASSEVLNTWVELVFNSAVGRGYFAGSSKQTTNLASINMTQLRSFPFPVPPLEQQEKILDVVHSLDELIESWRSKYKQLNDVSRLLAAAAVNNLTGITTPQEEEPLKTPQTELVAPVVLGSNKPNNKDAAPLTTLVARQNGQINANDLWQRFGGEIDAFYNQLKAEVAHGWLAEPAEADMLEKDAV